VSYFGAMQPLLTYTARPMNGKLFRIAIALVRTLLILALPSAGQKIKGDGYTAYSVAAKDPQPLSAPTFAAVLLGGHGDVDEATSF
jgi:hypothetical protein